MSRCCRGARHGWLCSTTRVGSENSWWQRSPLLGHRVLDSGPPSGPECSGQGPSLQTRVSSSAAGMSPALSLSRVGSREPAATIRCLLHDGDRQEGPAGSAFAAAGLPKGQQCPVLSTEHGASRFLNKDPKEFLEAERCSNTA